MSSKLRLTRITVHNGRHVAATLLKKLRVADRDIQIILGHAHVTTTQQLYQHADVEGQADALDQIEQLLLGPAHDQTYSDRQPRLLSTTAVNDELSTGESTELRAFTSGGLGGAQMVILLEVLKHSRRSSF